MTDIPEDKELDPKVDQPIDGYDGSQDALNKELDSGMTVGEAITEAAIWWENKGRRLVRDQNLAPDNPGYRRFNPAPSNDVEAENWFPSGVMAGKSWADLTQREKMAVVKHWHHHHVRVPNVDPELYLRAKKRPGICIYCDEPAVCDETLPNGEIREMCWAHFMDRYPAEAQAHMDGPANDG